MSRAIRAAPFGLPYGQNNPGLDNTDPADFFADLPAEHCRLDDALAHADHHGLMREDDHTTEGIYERAGFNSDTGLAAAFRNPCMIEAGSMMLAESDDSYLEV